MASSARKANSSSAAHDTLLLKANSLDDASNFADFERRIKEKERDLELAAKIGKSLLDQNRELQERNEFLEESLSTSNEAVQQLQYQLQQRSDLLNAFAEYDDLQQYSNTPEQEFRPNFIEKLENRVKELENENIQLRNELNQRDSNNEKQETRVKNYLTQLEKANFKIVKLQSQITDKNKNCFEQADEIQRLLKEIGRRKERERMISQENVDLQSELSVAVQNHEELRTEIEALQEKYCDIVAMLNETQDELKTARSEKKASSLNSLYDSLASELEASDSGFYSSPMVSARTESRHRLNDLPSPVNALQLELERLNKNTSPIDEIPSCSSQLENNNNCDASTSMDDALKLDFTGFYDVPSKALMDSVKKSMHFEERRSRRSHSSVGSTTNHSPRAPNKTPTSRELSLQQLRQQSTLEAFDELKETRGTPTEVIDPQPSTSQNQIREIVYENRSCSPIVIETPPDPSPRNLFTGSISIPYSGATSYLPNSSEDTTSHMLSSTSPSSSSSDEEEETPRSSDSMQDYNGPKFGQPGSPGSRDLEFSLKKMQLHKKLDQQYKEFRKNRGLGPSSIRMHSTGSKPKLDIKGLDALANRLGLASIDRPSSLSFSTSSTHTNQIPTEDKHNNNVQQRLPTSNSLCINDNQASLMVARPRALNRSGSIGLQLWKHSNQHKQQTPRGIDNAVKDRMPLVCGVLWRNVAPRKQSQQSIETPKNHSDLQRQIAEMPGASSSQIFDALGLSPVRQQTDPTPMEYLGKFLNFEAKNSTSLTDKLINGNNGLGSILCPSTNNTIIQRSFLNGRPSNS